MSARARPPASQFFKFAMTRGARYNTHEHPNQQALGKARYGDDEMIATPGWDWRADVDSLNAREKVDPERPARLAVIERFADRVLAGELTARDMFSTKQEDLPGHALLGRAGCKAAEWKLQDADAAARRVYEERRQAAEAEQAERSRRGTG